MVLGVDGGRRGHRVLWVVPRGIISVKTLNNPLATVYVQEVWRDSHQRCLICNSGGTDSSASRVKLSPPMFLSRLTASSLAVLLLLEGAGLPAQSSTSPGSSAPSSQGSPSS